MSEKHHIEKHHIKVRLDEFGRGTVVLDGIDISGKVTKASLVYSALGLGQVTLKLVPMTVDWESDQRVITIEDLTGGKKD